MIFLKRTWSEFIKEIVMISSFAFKTMSGVPIPTFGY